MNIKLKNVTVRELTNEYKDNSEEGVIGYGGNLDIRPSYQREFIYNSKQSEAVIKSIMNDYPLNVMYWAVQKGKNNDKKYEIIDGQQRTISICQYVNGDFSFDGRYIDNLTTDKKKQLMDYKLMVYECEGTESERLEWFKIINIAGEKLTDQELRNAVYAGPWVSNAKKLFSRRGCPAYEIASDYISGSTIRQDILETAIKWASKDNIVDYMGKNQYVDNANLLWNYFHSVISWAKNTFPEKRKYLKTVQWGPLYDEFGKCQLDPKKLEEKIIKLILDDDVTNKSGIYKYLLTKDQRSLSIRAFTDSMKQKAYELQDGICSNCKKKFDISDMEGDHIEPWSDGGKTTQSNCRMLCKRCNREKSSK